MEIKTLSEVETALTAATVTGTCIGQIHSATSVRVDPGDHEVVQREGGFSVIAINAGERNFTLYGTDHAGNKKQRYKIAPRGMAMFYTGQLFGTESTEEGRLAYIAFTEDAHD